MCIWVKGGRGAGFEEIQRGRMGAGVENVK